PTNPETIYAGFGNVYRSSDAGWNWSKISNFNTVPTFGYPNLITSLVVPSADTGFIYLTKRVYHSYDEPGAMWKSENSGSTWTDITTGLPDSLYFTYIAVDDTDENIVWVTCSGFEDSIKVFKTLDGGNNWTNITNNLPNLPVNCIVHHELSKFNTVYIGTDIGVYYTNDSLQNIWQLYSDGLPNVIVSELEIHNATQKLYAATFGRGLWSVGLTEIVDTTNTDTSNTGGGGDTTFVSNINSFRDMNINITPNPNNGNFLISFNNEKLSTLSFELIDINGRLVYDEQIKLSSKKYLKSYNLNLTSGIYYLRFTTNNLSQSIRFIIDK
ncbi:MAG: T9SS type A sorting domain-containing protein, partial [Bacteroidia bacterium]|nr:T9SS type A sorting domain-containing protein [Bacteroidia bacterium]